MAEFWPKNGSPEKWAGLGSENFGGKKRKNLS